MTGIVARRRHALSCRTYHVTEGCSDERSTAYEQLRLGVRQLCERFPVSYWRELDERSAYPEEFVEAMTKAGHLAALIPEEYGGGGVGVTEASIILEEVNHSGGNAGPCHAQMYTMGTVLRHGSESKSGAISPVLPRGNCGCNRSGLRNRTRDQTHSASPPPRCATATCTWSTAEDLELPAPTIRT